VRVAQVCHYYLPHLGGIEIYTRRTARDLLLAGDECRVFTSRHSLGEGAALPEATYLPSMVSRSPYVPGIAKAVASYRPDVVHAQSIWFWPSVQVARLDLPLVVTVHGLWPDESSTLLRIALRGFQPLAQRVLDKARVVIMLSEEEREKLHQRFRVDAGKVRIIGNGPDVVTPEPPKRGRYFLFTGRIIPEKNAHVLAAAFKQVETDAELVFLGPCDAAYAAKLRAFKPGKIFVEEPVDPVREAGKLAGWYAAAELSVAIGEWEGQPTRVLESLAQGTPALSSSTLIRDGENGLFVRSAAMDKLRMLLIHWLSLKDREAMRARARASAQPHLWPTKFKLIREALAEAAR
jgi:glycosyltransferase involved in cell wall biosynthesis